jgi:hypothetical protein
MVFDVSTACQGFQLLKQFPSVLLSMLASTIPISISDVRFALSVTKFWELVQYSKFRQVWYKATFFHDKPQQFPS